MEHTTTTQSLTSMRVLGWEIAWQDLMVGPDGTVT
jgi:hypothetical protein